MSVENGKNEEVDLGNLFKLIGQGIKALFTSVVALLERLFHNLILLLIFLRKHALKLGIAVGIGAGLGLYLDLTKPDVFTSAMIVQPNFKSTQQLYNNIGFYHELVKQKDSIALAKALDITPYEASKLKGFYIKPIKNDNEKIELFDEFIEEVDTTTVKNIDLKEFKRNFTDFDYKYHEVKVHSELNDIYNKISNSIINSIINNSYFKNQKKINDENLIVNERLLEKSLTQIDTLRKIYYDVLLKEASKADSGTTITLAQGVKKTEEIALFDESLELNKELIDNNLEKAKTTEILNVVSSFNSIGSKERAIYKKYTVVLAGIAFIAVLLVILLANFDKFLRTYNSTE